MAAFQYQLSDAKNSYEIQSVVGACPNSADFLALVNTVTRRLMKRGNFWETEWLLKLCISGCYVVFPEFVGTVLALRFCGSSQSVMHNKWWSLIGPRTCGGWCDGITIKEGNTAPTYNVVSGTTGKLIRYYAEKNADIGKTITLYGKKYGGGPLMEFVDGQWREGLTLTCAAPFGTTTVLVTEITAVVRQASAGIMRLYEYDASTDLLRDLALYGPNETNPRYRTSIISNACTIPFCTDENGVKTAHVEALVKLNYRPLINDNDFMLIDDFDAIALGIQAVKLEQANDHQGAEAKWMQSIRELNYGTRDKQPDLQSSIRLNVWGDGTGVLCNPI